MLVAKRATPSPVTLQYADIFKIPRILSVPFSRDVERWIKCSGIEWTVKRLKDMKLDLVRLKAGLSPCSQWISQEDKIFKGSFGGLVKWASRDYKRWSKAILFLQMYTQYYSPQVTNSQEKKFLDGVNANSVVIPSPLIDDIRLAVKRAGIKKHIVRSPRSILFQVPSTTRREPHADGRSFPEGEATLECATSFTRGTRIGWDIRSKYKKIFDIVEEGIILEDHRDGDIADYPNCVGKIGLIQEAGFKLRAVANPARIYQEALRPLGDQLYDILKVLPWDCTHNQELPMIPLVESLRHEKMIYSIDLSGATDYFPLDLQIEVLDEIFPDKEYINLFRALSRAPWRYGKKFIRWSKGQPLGLYPSFASFALTHGLLLFALNDFKHNNMFFVLGDDVVILDSILNDKYRDILNILECPVSESKSISSSLLCEFAGRIITREGVFSQLKWRTPSDDSFLDIIRNIGLSAMPLLRPRQQRIVRILSEVPDFMGGLGFNPNGRTLEDRISSSFDLFNKEKVMSYLMSYNRKISNCNYYNEDTFPPYRSLRIEKEDLDKRSISHVQRFLPNLINWYEILGSNLWTIDNDLSLPINAPTGRRTRLEQLENDLIVRTSNI
jgi:hypothetical protein